MKKDKLNNILGEENFNIRDKNSQKKGKKEKIDHKKPLTDSEKIKSKAEGAIAEVSRQAERDKTTEASYSTELNSDLSFIDDSSKIDNERAVLVDNLAAKVNKIAATTEPTDVEIESFGAANVELNKRMEEMMAGYEAEDTVVRELVIPDHILAEQKIDDEKKTQDLLDTIYTKQPLITDDKDIVKTEELSSEELLDILSGDQSAESKNKLNSEQVKLLRKTNVLNLSGSAKREMLSNITKPDSIVIEGRENVIKSSAELDSQESVPLTDIEKKEYEPSPLFNKFVLSKLKGWSKEHLESSLIDEAIGRQEVKAWNCKYIVAGLVSFSSVGYSTYLTNIEEVKGEDGIDTKSEKAIYGLVSPDGAIIYNNLNHEGAMNLLWSESENYLINLNKEFEENKEAIEKELGSTENTEVENNQPENINQLENIVNAGKQNQEILKYAESMGIKAEQLAAHPEFLELNLAQQQFVLEALNRASLCKIKVEAHQNFLAEKENKKWYHLGFALNQKFHQKKHEVLAAKNIHEQGLEGYGETELSWLISIVKNGPEMKLDEDGDLESVDYLKIEGDITPERQALIKKYNEEAYYFSRISVGDEDYKLSVNDVKKAREALLVDAENDQDGGAELVNKLIESEKQLKLHQFLSSDAKNERIIQNLVDNSLGSWQKFGMMLGGQSDKAKYAGVGMGARVLLRGEISTAIIGKGLSYAIGPVVAAAMGAWRSNNRARAGLKEEAELSKIGIASDNKLVKSLNLAVGSKEGDGKIINIGLADKLENLMAKCNALTAQANELEKTKTPDQEVEFQNLKTEEMKLWERLMDRIEYTSQKMEAGLVSFGAPAERAQNYYRLLNAVEEAKLIVFNEYSILDYQNRLDKTKTSSRVTELTRSNKKIKDINSDQEFQNLKKALLAEDLAPEVREELEIKKQKMVRDWYRLDELNNLSVSARLASFLNFKEEERQSAEFKFLVKETTKGAVMGASMAAVGAWIFEHTGLGNWTSAQLHNLGQVAHLDQAVNWTKNLFSSDDISSKAVEKVAVTVMPEKVVTSVPKVEITEVKTTPVNIEKAVPVSNPGGGEVIQENIAPKTYSETISSEPGKSNSVWRSLREIFKNNSQELGYKGDINDAEALNRWSESQTANAIHNSGDVTDKVFEGNKISLVEDNGQFKVNVEAGEGQTPDYLNVENAAVANPETPQELGVKEITQPVAPIENNLPIENVIKAPVEEEGPISEGTTTWITKEMSDKWHLPIDKTEIVDATHIFYSSKDGAVLIDTAKGAIDIIQTSKMVEIPREFINEIKGRTPLDRFLDRGGLDKIFSNWNKLSVEDKTIYESLHAFNLNKLTPFDLINKISGTFKVVAKDVVIDMDAKHFILGNREFNLDADGVHKLVKVLTRRFGA